MMSDLSMATASDILEEKEAGGPSDEMEDLRNRAKYRRIFMTEGREIERALIVRFLRSRAGLAGCEQYGMTGKVAEYVLSGFAEKIEDAAHLEEE